MTKVSSFPTKSNPSPSDTVGGNDNENGKKFVNFTIESIVSLVNSISGKDYITYKFSPNYGSIGLFSSNEAITNPTQITKLFFNKQSVSKEDLTALFVKLDTLQNIVIDLRNPSNSNNFATFKITNITNQTEYFELDVTLYKSFYSGNLVANATYSAYFDVKENFEDKLDQGNYVGTAETLKTDIETRQPKSAGKSLVADAEITKLSHLDDTTDLQKPISTAQAVALADKLSLGGYVGTAQDLEDAITAAVTGVTGQSLVPSSPAFAGTGIASGIALEPGTYTNLGGVVVNANSIAVIARDALGAYSITQTALVLTGYVQKTDVIDSVTSTETQKPASANSVRKTNDNTSVYTQNHIANRFIKEIYILGDWGTSDIYFDEYVREASSYRVIFKNSAGVIIYIVHLNSEDINNNVVYKKEGTKEFYAVFNWEVTEVGVFYFGLNALLNNKSKSLACNPAIGNYILNQNTPLALEALTVKLETDNLISKYYSNKWIEPDKIGTNIYEAIENSDNNFGIVCEPVYVGDGISLEDEIGEENTEYNYYSDTGGLVLDPNMTLLELDADKIIVYRRTLSTTAVIRTTKRIKYIVLMYPQGYEIGYVITTGAFKTNEYIPKISVGKNKLASVLENNQWVGKKVCTYGDSITQYGFWQKNIKKYFGFSEIYERGVSGAKVSDNDPFYYWANSDGSLHSFLDTNPTQPGGTHQVWSNYSDDTRIATIPLDSELIIVMGGTNDSGFVPIGDVTYPFNNSTLKGALSETIRKIQIRCPDAIIALATPLSIGGQIDNYLPNSNGDTLVDFALAVKDVAFKMSTPCIDVFGTCGINLLNKSTYLNPDNTHPTYGNEIITNEGTGSSMIARAMISGIKSIVPKDTLLSFLTQAKVE